jgi:hypothetical protein
LAYCKDKIITDGRRERALAWNPAPEKASELPETKARAVACMQRIGWRIHLI